MSVYKVIRTLSSKAVSEKPDASDFRAEERCSIFIRNINILIRKYTASEDLLIHNLKS